MIVIPRRLKIKKHRLSTEFRHYELQEDKCTSKLAVYRCLETGCIETWKKSDFEIKDKKRKERDGNHGV